MIKANLIIKQLSVILLLLLLLDTAFGQAIVSIQNACYIVENGGTAATPVYIANANPAANGFVNAGGTGWIISENEFNMVEWNIKTTIGTYIVPFGYSTAKYLPLTFNISTAGVGNGVVKFSTYHTIADQLTGVVSTTGDPSDVTNMTPYILPGSPSNVDDSYNVVDRFYIIDANTGYTTKPTAGNITFSYISGTANSEVAAPNILVEARLMGLRFNSTSATWNDWFGAGCTDAILANVGTVQSGPVSAANLFRSWALWDETMPLPMILTSTNVNCGGSNSGSATVTVSGGTLPYTYVWTTSGGSSSNATGLSAGTYTISVNDNHGCTSTATVTITQAPALTATMSLPPTNVLCNGGSTGSATVNTTGGNPPYTYLWASSGGTGSTGTGLSASTYTVTVTDNAGCTSTASVTITQPMLLTATMGTPTNVLCNGGTNGSSLVTAGGGSPPYTYAWATSGGTNALGTGLSAGTYTTTVTDNNGCTATASVIITEPTPLIATMGVPTNVPCFGGDNGSATVTGAGGIIPYTYAWITSGGTGATGTGLSAGTYTVTITDNNGCTSTAPVTISEPIAITATTTTTQASCGNNNGTATITTSGGTSPYTYLWTPSSNTGSTATGLSVGTYTVTITDNDGCTQTATAIITSSSTPTVTVTVVTDVLCNGNSTGTATVTGAGGATPYTYLWAPAGGTTATGTGLSAGTYTVTLTDNNGCAVTVSATITQPPALTATMGLPTNVLCSGGANGSAEVTAGGGVSPYTYAWAPVGGTTATGTGLSAGTYTTTVTDNNGCAATATVTITQPPPFTATMGAPTNVLCNGGSTGIAAVTGAGGASPYTFLWSPIGGTSATGTGFSAGTYTVTITDNEGCISTADVIITEPTAITVNITTTAAACTSNNGTATATVSGGTPFYTYSWNPSGNTGSTATGLSVGIYTVTVTDNNGCTYTITANVPSSSGLNANITASTNISCNGGTNGSITVTASGGTSPYTYLWNPSGIITSTAGGLSAGTYTITVTDNNGCTAVDAITLTQPVLLTATMGSPTNVLCNGNNNGAATVTAGGGASPYAYAWASAGGTNAMGTGFSAGTYTVTITDNNGCAATASVTITQPPSLTAIMGIPTNTMCNGGNNSSVSVTVTGGTSAYNYVWTPTGGSSSAATGLSAGTFTVNITDINGCTASASVTISSPTALSVTLNPTGLTCWGADNGSIVATPAGGTSPYTYAWTPTGGNAATASNLAAGTYTVTISDINGCTTTASAIVTQPTELIVSATGPGTICAGGNATLNSNVSGGTGLYNYTWSSGGTTSSTIVSPVSTSTYTLTVTDANGCTASAAVTVTTSGAINVIITGADSFCVGDSTVLTAMVSGGSGVYTYLWLPGNSTTNYITAYPTSTTVYSVEVNSGCGSGFVTATFTVTVFPLPVTSFEANPYSGCAPLCVQFRDMSTVSTGTITQWEWNFGRGDTIGPRDPIYCFPDTGTFSVILTTTSNNGCISTLVKTRMITVYPPPNVNFTYTPQPINILDPQVQFSAIYSDKYPPVYWYWNFGDGADSISNLINPEHTYSDTGNYCVTLIATDQHGCADTITNCLIVNPLFTLYIPNAFSPNSDGLNDVFMPKGSYIKVYDMYIFNRWEAQIFHSNEITMGWNGKVNGTGDVCQEDAYFYLINVTDTEGKIHSYTGQVTLIK
jgi:large repetitive protein